MKNNKFLANLAIHDTLSSLCSIIAISSLNFIEGTRLKKLIPTSAKSPQIQEFDTKTIKAQEVYEIHLKNAFTGKQIDFKSDIFLNADDVNELKEKLLKQPSDWRSGVYEKISLKIPLRYDYSIRCRESVELDFVGHKMTIKVKEFIKRSKTRISNSAKEILDSIKKDAAEFTKTELERITVCIQETESNLNRMRELPTEGINKANQKSKKAKSKFKKGQDVFLEDAQAEPKKNGNQQSDRHKFDSAQSKAKDKNNPDNLIDSISEAEIRLQQLKSEFIKAESDSCEVENFSLALEDKPLRERKDKQEIFIPDCLQNPIMGKPIFYYKPHVDEKKIVQTDIESFEEYSTHNTRFINMTFTDEMKIKMNRLSQSEFKYIIKQLIRITQSSRDTVKENPESDTHMKSSPLSQTELKYIMEQLVRIAQSSRDTVKDNDEYGFHMNIYPDPESDTHIKCVIGILMEKIEEEITIVTSINSKKLKESQKEWSGYLRSVCEFTWKLSGLHLVNHFDVWLHREKLPFTIFSYREIEKLPKMIYFINNLASRIGLDFNDTYVLLDNLYNCLSDLQEKRFRIKLISPKEDQYLIEYMSDSKPSISVVKFLFHGCESSIKKWCKGENEFITSQTLDEFLESSPNNEMLLEEYVISDQVSKSIGTSVYPQMIQSMMKNLLMGKRDSINIEWLMDSYKGLDLESILNEYMNFDCDSD